MRACVIDMTILRSRLQLLTQAHGELGGSVEGVELNLSQSTRADLHCKNCVARELYLVLYEQIQWNERCKNS